MSSVKCSSWPAVSVPTFIVRNFHSVKRLPRYPTRSCLKNTGPGDRAFMSKAVPNSNVTNVVLW